MFDYSELELEKVIPAYFKSADPLVLREFPSKQKKKYLILLHIIKKFSVEQQYSEADVNEILMPIFDDYVSLRRALVDFRLMERTKDGKKYWLTQKKT